MQHNNIYDIGVSLGEESIDYPGDTPFSRELILTIQDSGICDLSQIVMSAYSGTHINTSAHFMSTAKILDSYTVGFSLVFYVNDPKNYFGQNVLLNND